MHTRRALIKRININNLRNTVKFKHFNEVDHEILNLAWLKKLHAYKTSLSTNQLFYSNFASKKETYVHRRKKNLSKLCLTVKNKTETGGFDCQRSIYRNQQPKFRVSNLYIGNYTYIARYYWKKEKEKEENNERKSQ